jgi:NADP-dependent aldehyde dehydrogenase
MVRNYRELRSEFLTQDGVTQLTSQKEIGGDTLAAGAVALVSADDFCSNDSLKREVFGPFTLLVTCENEKELLKTLRALEGQLTASLLGDEEELESASELLSLLSERAGRILINGVPTGVEVCPSMHHGGPYPATTDSRFTSVGTDAVKRWVRPVAYQNLPQGLLPPALRDGNPLGIWRTVNGAWTSEAI